jgi:FAD/FMN-containing dehydrogenase
MVKHLIHKAQQKQKYLIQQVERKLHKSVKLAMDPAGILNPGRLYPEC